MKRHQRGGAPAKTVFAADANFEHRVHRGDELGARIGNVGLKTHVLFQRYVKAAAKFRKACDVAKLAGAHFQFYGNLDVGLGVIRRQGIAGRVLPRQLAAAPLDVQPRRNAVVGRKKIFRQKAETVFYICARVHAGVVRADVADVGRKVDAEAEGRDFLAFIDLGVQQAADKNRCE